MGHSKAKPAVLSLPGLEWCTTFSSSAGMALIPRQHDALRVLHALGIPALLAAYAPTLAGTVPIGVDIESSDLDVLCHASNIDAFAADVRRLYSGESGFDLRRPEKAGIPSVVADFVRDGWPVQIFAQPVPVERQRGWLHLVAEARLLALAGPDVRAAIRALKRSGVKTEPAFARLFGLPGDPYETLAALAHANEATLRAAIRSGGA